jgi:hypothetical protein
MPRLLCALALLTTACATDWSLTELQENNADSEDDYTFLDDGVRDQPESDDETDDDPGEEDQDTDEDDPEEFAEEEDDTPDEEEPPEDDCTETSDLIYVIDRGQERLMLFDPGTSDFTTLGELDCPSWGTPASMAVSRTGFVYVRYSDDVVYEVDLVDLSCESTTLSVPTGFGSFGMGYATDDGDTWRDQLYVADADSLGRVSNSSWSLSLIGSMPSQSELTGNAAGELWAFLPLESPPALAQMDKDSGGVLDRINLSGFPNLGDIDTFAFAAWDGNFWLFVRTYGMGSSTDVYRVGDDGRLTTVRSDVGFDVVGAGVSTCAPD